MSVNIKLNNVVYNGVNTVKLPLATGTGYAFFNLGETPVYGVEWNYDSQTSAITRTDDAANLSAPVPATSLSGSGSSPFDSIYPWSDIKRYNVIDNSLSYSDSDANFNETNYDTVVYIPQFYYKAEKDTTNHKWKWSIRENPADGYALHPGSGRYIGRFDTSGSSSGAFSRSGATPLHSISCADMRTVSHNKGSRWWMLDIAGWSAIQLLYLIEFANFDSQTMIGYGNNTGTRINTGGTTGAVYHTVKRTGEANMYRWIENPWSNIYTMFDGIVLNSKTIYMSTDYENYDDNISNMTAAGVTLPGNGKISGFGYSSQFPWAFIPDTSSSSATAVTDSIYALSGTNYIMQGGGNVSNNADYGLYNFGSAMAISATSDVSGTRLMYI